MPFRLLVTGLLCLAVGFLALRAGYRAAGDHRWTGSVIRTLLGLLFLALAGLAAAIGVGLRGYQALTLEDLAATVATQPVSPQRFRATIVFPDRRLAMYELAGDAFYIDARILKWHPLANLVGLHTDFELDRVAGRYNNVADERTKPHTTYELAPPRSRFVDLFFLARRRLLGPLVDAEYGSAAFVAAGGPAQYEVRVSTSGLLMRPLVGHPNP